MGQVRITRPFELLRSQRSVIKPGAELHCGKSSASLRCKAGGGLQTRAGTGGNGGERGREWAGTGGI